MRGTGMWRRAARSLPTAIGSSILIGGASLLFMPATAGNRNGNGGGGSSPGCAEATTSVSLSWVPPGYSVGITSPVINCSDQRQQYDVTHSFTSSCGVTEIISDASISFDPQEAKLVSVSYRVPEDACLGYGQVTVEVSDQGEQLAIASDDLLVAFVAGPGRVPTTLRVDKSGSTPGDLAIDWSQSCSSGAEDYGIYEGQIGDWDSHVQIDCFDDGADLTEEVTPAPGDRYYLVVPFNSNEEGSYGTGLQGTERPVGTSVCVASQSVAPCP